MKLNHPQPTNIRTVEIAPEIRSLDGGGNYLFGYAAKFNELSLDLGGFKERLHPDCFNNSLKNPPAGDLYCLYGHDWNRILGRLSAGNLRLGVDSIGLFFECTPLDTTLGRDTLIEVSGKVIQGCSFGFNIVAYDVVNEDGGLIQEISDLELYEISVVGLPAYPSTVVSIGSELRSAIEARNAPQPVAPVVTAPSQTNILLQRQKEIELLLAR